MWMLQIAAVGAEISHAVCASDCRSLWLSSAATDCGPVFKLGPGLQRLHLKQDLRRPWRRVGTLHELQGVGAEALTNFDDFHQRSL